MTDFLLQKEWQDRLKREVLKDAVNIIVKLGESMLDKNRMAATDVTLTPEETVAKVAEEARSSILARKMQIAPKIAQHEITEAGRAMEKLERN